MSEDRRAAAFALLEKSFTSKAIKEMTAQAQETGFCSEMGGLAIENVFMNLWTRPGLDARSRSLVTLGILIALHSTEELKIHAAAAIANGLSVAELEEVIYHASGYAGFPAANSARLAAAASLKAEGLI
jgi:4-carboxymuconolactone decarboxylase